MEALTANGNVEGVVKLAKEFNARFVAVADESKLDELRAALAGTGIASGAGDSAIVEAARAAGRLADGRRVRAPPA